MLPLGGLEETAGYKGYGLSVMVDILTGVLAGAHFGPHIVGLFSISESSDLGHAFWVVDPAAIGSGGVFESRLEAYLDELTAAETQPDAPGRVLVPGEPEAEAERRSDQRGVVLDQQHLRALEELSKRLGVATPSATSA